MKKIKLEGIWEILLVLMLFVALIISMTLMTTTSIGNTSRYDGLESVTIIDQE